jgi:sec-independent protein translocase protein TatA
MKSIEPADFSSSVRLHALYLFEEKCRMIPKFGPVELILILVIVTMLFGVGKLPEVFGSVGRGIREFRRNSADPDATETEVTETVVTKETVATPVTTVTTVTAAQTPEVAAPPVAVVESVEKQNSH